MKKSSILIDYDHREYTTLPCFLLALSQIKKLTENTYGVNKKKKPNQIHHYATNKSKTYIHQIEQVTKKYDLDLDEGWNKELLPHQG